MKPEPDPYRPGGIVHIYQKYDPQRLPSPTQDPPDLVSGAFDHWLAFGSRRPLTPEQLANAIHLDPSQIQGLGPSIDSLLALLRERRRKILETYETDSVQELADAQFRQQAASARLPKALRQPFADAVKLRQRYLLERLWFRLGDDSSPAARDLLNTMERLGEKYEVDELAAKYAFTGREPLSVPQAIEVKQELERIDQLIEQLEQARETAQIGLIDMDALSEFAEPGDLEQLQQLQQMVDSYLRELAESQGLERDGDAYRITPQAYRLFQGRLLERIFRDLQASRTGRHESTADGEGAVEMPQTKPYEFGDSVANIDLPQSLMNAMLRRTDSTQPVRLRPDDIEVHRTRNRPKCATVVVMDMSGSMRYDGQFIHVKRMALALDGLIRREYPGDYLQFIEMYTFARVRQASEIVDLMPKPVTIYDPVVRLRADMSRADITESMIHPHFTNIQHSLQLARRLLMSQASANRQVILITDGLPTAHLEDEWLFMLYPPDPRTEQATMRESQLCRRDGITLNIFLVPSWSQSEEDIRFAYRMAESTRGRVFFTAGRDLDRFVVWDYVSRRREIIQ